MLGKLPLADDANTDRYWRNLTQSEIILRTEWGNESRLPMSEPTDSVRAINRRAAQSGTVSYGAPVIIRDNSRTRVQFVPFFVPHNNGTELALKIITYKKSPPPSDWPSIEEKSLSLNESEGRQLLAALRDHLAVAEESHDGRFIVIRVDEGTANFGDNDPAAVAASLARVLGQNDIVQHLAGTELSDGLVDALRGAIRLREMRAAVSQLRILLDSGEATEERYQEWCKEHSWAFGNAYVKSDEVRDISTGDTIDLLLPTVISGYRDIVELKRPDRDVLLYDGSHRNFYFSADVSRALGQVHRYLDVLQEEATNGLRDHPEIVAYHPRATIIIGRSEGWNSEQLKALHGLNSRLSGVTVMTYDQLLTQGERLIAVLYPNETASPMDDEDIPF
jgi:hypothetical protein